jgi:hypothetical protein
VEGKQDGIDSHEPPEEKSQPDDAFHDRDEKEQGPRIELVGHHFLGGINGENLGRAKIRVKLEKPKVEINEAKRNPNEEMGQGPGVCRIWGAH